MTRESLLKPTLTSLISDGCAKTTEKKIGAAEKQMYATRKPSSEVTCNTDEIIQDDVSSSKLFE